MKKLAIYGTSEWVEARAKARSITIRENGRIVIEVGDKLQFVEETQKNDPHAKVVKAEVTDKVRSTQGDGWWIITYNVLGVIEF